MYYILSTWPNLVHTCPKVKALWYSLKIRIGLPGSNLPFQYRGTIKNKGSSYSSYVTLDKDFSANWVGDTSMHIRRLDGRMEKSLKKPTKLILFLLPTGEPFIHGSS